MKDLVGSCFSEHAVLVSDSSCSGRSSKSSIVSVDISSVQTSITTLYRTTHKGHNIKLTWSKTPIGPVLSIAVLLDDDHQQQQQQQQQQSTPPMLSSYSSSSSSFNFNNCQLLRKRKGSRCYASASGGSTVGLYWDYSNANFSSSPEPVSNFYVVVVIGAELGLLLGDLGRDYIKKKFEEMITTTTTTSSAQFSIVSRKEQVVGNEVYSTKARFSDDGKEHDILIRCKGDSSTSSNCGGGSELTVSIDKKRVVHVRRLQWNFRGNQTIFVDGSPVDMMWDLRDWWFSSPPGYAVFMFRKRSALESRLWFEEMLLLHKENGRGIISGFSLLIQAFKTTTTTTTPAS